MLPTLYFVQAAGLFLWQQVGVGIFSGMDFVAAQPPTQKQNESGFNKSSKKTQRNYRCINKADLTDRDSKMGIVLSFHLENMHLV